MPNEPQRPQRPGWKSAGKQPGPRPKHAWQGGAAKASAEPAHRGLSRRGKLGLIGAGFALLAVCLVILIALIRKPKPSNLEVVYAGHEGDITSPPIARGAGAKLFTSDDEQEKLHPESHALSVEDDPWKGIIERSTGSLLGGKPPEKVVLFLATPGGADEKGPYLIPNGANPTDTSRFLHLDALVDTLRRLPSKTKKLVVFDAVQSPSFWPLGLVRNDFAKRLKEHNLKSVDNLIVICSAEEGQRSWVAEEWGQSAFAHYFLKALQNKQGNQASIKEIFDRVQREVSEWVYDNWAAYQVPFMLDHHGIAGQMVFAAQRGSDAAEPTEPPPLDGPAKAWSKRDELANSFPPPWASAPHQWRQYQDWLIRFENLVRIGADTTTAQKKLNELAAQIENSGREPLTSLRATLRASTSLASRPGDAEDVNLDKEVTGAIENSDRDAALNKVRDLAGTKEPVRWSAILGILLNQAIRDPAKNLARACELAGVLVDDTTPPPSEILLMLELNGFHKDRASQLAAYIGAALSVRKQAEEAALGLMVSGSKTDPPAYSEQVLPWIKSDVEEGDRLRRIGEDNLFCGKKAAWSTAAGRLKNAAASYAGAQRRALQIRKAMAARDELLAALPYYAHWQAASRKPGVSVVGIIVELCRQAHELDRLLADPKRSTPADTLEAKAGEAQQKFKVLKDDFQKQCNSLVRDDALESSRHEIEAVLRVPFIDSELRLKLLQSSRKIGRGLRDKQRRDSKRDFEDVKKHEQEIAAGQALRETQLAFAVFGLDKGAENDPAAAGRVIAQRWLDRLRAVQEGTEKGGNAANLAAARDALITAGAAVQQLDGAAGSCLTEVNPIAARRHVQLHDLLAWQAERTYRDHWFHGETPYYWRIGQDYLKDAQTLITMDFPTGASTGELDQRCAVVKSWGERFEKAVKMDGFWLDEKLSLKVLKLTDETAMPREYKITIPDPVDEGAIALRFEHGAGILPPTRDWEDWSLFPIEPGKREVVGEDKFSVEKKPPQQSRLKPDKSKHALQAYFRGQLLLRNTEVQIYRKPDILAARRQMPPGRIAVQAEEKNYNTFRARNTAIAFVLDASGSMNYAPDGKSLGTKAERNRRFDRALDALSSVLTDLPDGISLSLRIFSQKEFGGKDTVIWPSVPWKRDRDVIRELVEQLRRLTPKGETPLIRNMKAAQEDFDPNFTGKKVMIVLTDGGDDLEPDKIPAAVADAFGNLPKDLDGQPTLLIRAIGFEVTDDRDRKRNERFQEALNHVGGKYFDVKDQRQLVTILRDSLSGLKFLVEDNTTGKVFEQGEVSSSIGEYKWTNKPMHPDLYSLLLRVKGENKYLRQRVRLDPGDVLALNLIPHDDYSFAFQRDIYAKSYSANRLGLKPIYFDDGDRKGWLGAVYQNRLTSRGALRMMTTLESLVTPRLREGQEGTLFQPKPENIWYEVNPEGAGERLALSYQPLPGYPAPAWELAVEDWPKSNLSSPRFPILDVWWLDRAGAEHAPNAFEQTIRAGVQFTVGKPVQKLEPEYAHGKELLFLDSIGVESMTFGGAPEKCLVARFRYDPSKRFMVRMRNPTTSDNQEHRFYTDAGKYVAVFRDWTEQKLLENERSLTFDLIDVNALKKAVDSTTHARVNLGKPNDRDRPQPPAPETIESR